jgi:peptidoglycan-associated lipoprotein
MKMMKLIYPLALAMAVTFAGAGCKHTPLKTTQLPGVTQPPQAPPPETSSGGGNQERNQLPPGARVNPEDGVNAVPQPYVPGTPLDTSTNWDFTDSSKWTADPGALAANTVHFAFDSAVVKSAEEANVQAVAGYLASNLNDKLLIEGNCDERGTEEYNRSLGERRALALREELAKLKVDPQRVRTISYGKDKPVDSGRDEAAFAKNRRGDFVIYHPKTGV